MDLEGLRDSERVDRGSHTERESTDKLFERGINQCKNVTQAHRHRNEGLV